MQNRIRIIIILSVPMIAAILLLTCGETTLIVERETGVIDVIRHDWRAEPVGEEHARLVIADGTLYVQDKRVGFFDGAEEIILLNDDVQVDRILNVDIGTSRDIESLGTRIGERIENVISEYFLIPNTYTDEKGELIEGQEWGGSFWFVSKDGALYLLDIRDGIFIHIRPMDFQINEVVMVRWKTAEKDKD